MTCLTVSLRGLPIRTLPEAQTLLEEPYGPEGRRAATGAAGRVWQANRRGHNQDEHRFALIARYPVASSRIRKADILIADSYD